MQALGTITYNKNNWTGKRGEIVTYNGGIFSIDNHFYRLEIEKLFEIVWVIDLESDRQYMGVGDNEGTIWTFSEFGIERENSNPLVAFAQLVSNL